MAYDDRPDNSIEPIADGMISLLQKNLVANSPLIQDAHAGDTTIYVNNTLRFDRKDKIVLMDNTSTHDPDTNAFFGIEFHTIKDYIGDANKIVLTEALEKDFLVSDNGRIQKTLRGAILYPKDILYGDREVIPFDQIAITVEPERLSAEWMALRLMSNEYRLSVNVYVKFGGSPEQEELAMRICNTYATAIYNLLMNNIHLDVVIDETPLTRDGEEGENFIYIPYADRRDWRTDWCARYEVKDNFGACQDLKIIDVEPWDSSSQSFVTSTSSASSSSSSELLSSSMSSTSSSTSSLSSSSPSSHSTGSSSSILLYAYSSSLSSLSSNTISSESSKSSGSSSTVSVSESSKSSGSSSSFSSSSASSLSSTSSLDEQYRVFFDNELNKDFSVRNKAVLRRIIRYMYDSRVSDVEYGTTQKGSALLKVGRLTWWGKETKHYSFPQVGKGDSIY